MLLKRGTVGKTGPGRKFVKFLGAFPPHQHFKENTSHRVHARDWSVHEGNPVEKMVQIGGFLRVDADEPDLERGIN